MKEKGVSAVVGAILTLSVLVPVLVFFTSLYEQSATRTAEIRQLEDVQMALCRFKSNLEALKPGETIRVSLPMSRESFSSPVPILPLGLSPSPLASIVKLSTNRLFVYARFSELPDVVLLYENGAVLIMQDTTGRMLSPPASFAWVENGGTLTVYHHVYELKGHLEVSATGSVTLIATCENLIVESSSCESSLTFRIHSVRPSAWLEFLKTENKLLQRLGATLSAEVSDNELCVTISREGTIQYVKSTHVFSVTLWLPLK